MLSLKRSVFVVCCFSVAAGSSAAVLFSQPNQSADGFFSDSVTYGAGATFWEQATADNFSLGTASTVTQIVFWGGSEGFFTSGLGNVTDFKINIYDSSWSLVSGNTVSKASLIPTVTGNTNSGTGIEHAFTFNTSIVLGAGSYWLHVGGIYAVAQDDAFVWSSNLAGNGISAFADLSVGPTFAPGPNSGRDQAFELRGDAVPEPASMAVLGLGAAALLRRRRR